MIDDLLDDIERTYAEVAHELGDPDVLGDRARYATVARRHGELEPLHLAVRDYRDVERALAEAEDLLFGADELDADMRTYLEEEIAECRGGLESLEEHIRAGMLAHDPNDEKDVILEIRGGTGGDEAAHFAADLFRMYARYAESKDFQVEVLSANEPPTGGFKEIIAEIRGRGAYSTLKYESGVHRVQRVPVTESTSRVHTSTATVAVLPEAEEIEVDIDPNELRIDIFRARGPGGQSVNTTDSAVRITHVPTGVTVSCQDEKSQYQNKDKAMRILRARLYEQRRDEQDREVAEARRDMVGTGDRAQKVRTYNYQQSRVTDHRIGFTTHRLVEVLDGDLDELTEALTTADRDSALARSAEPD